MYVFSRNVHLTVDWTVVYSGDIDVDNIAQQTRNEIQKKNYDRHYRQRYKDMDEEYKNDTQCDAYAVK